LTPAEEQQLVTDIVTLTRTSLHLADSRGRDPVDALMMLLVAASQIYRDCAIDPNSMGEIHEALDKAMEAAASWFVSDEGSNLQ